ncbi:innexin shaking-B-like [Bradysia coprophila]|uniref:innexin shaking-B-like n=1 Tax=Bradysia coprophila TaxID=38358 RepID=UPI00187D9CFF|nr:innexin shaking-B-like [Bradysia coprophila]
MTIKEIIVSVADQLAYSQVSKVTTSEFTFNLVTRTTPKVLLIFAFVITIRQLFGNPIECQPDPSYEKYTKQIETRCWIEGSYIIREHLEGTIGKNLVNYGIGTKMRNEERMYQTYYQWVTPSLLIMALIFYFPHFVWHNWEGGTMEKLLKDIDSPYIQEDCWNNQRERLLRYMHGPKRYHRHYAIKYYLCEFIALCALVFNMNMMSVVFNNFWVEYFPAIRALLNHNFEDFTKQSSVLFPSQAKCDYFNFGSSGSIQHIDALCILPQNVVNEKIFVFLYFWMIMLLFFSFFHVICVAVKVIYQCRKDKEFGFYLVQAIIKKNLSPVLVEDLLEAKKVNPQ